MSPAGQLRFIRRSCGLAAVILAGLPLYLWFLCTHRHHHLDAKGKWMQWMCLRFLRLLNCTVQIKGNIPRHGLIVSNHLSYVDILVIGSVCPAIFVAKSDVRRWLIFGWLATMAGTIFVERKISMTIRQQLTAINRPLTAGFPVVLFPEGTSSDGSRVLRFRSSLLEAAHLSNSPITPAAIRYDLAHGGSIAQEVCYWGDMVLAPHLVNLLSKESLTATLSFAPSQPPKGNRKISALLLRSLVSKLH